MKEEGEKKRGLLLIARILREHTDEAHPLTQQDIIKYLAEDFNVYIDRKSVRRNLSALVEAGCPICFYERERRGKDGKTSMAIGWYWKPLIEGDAADALIDMLYFMPISQKLRMDFAEIFTRFVGPYTETKRMEITGLTDSSRMELVALQKKTVDELVRAIRKRVKINFCYRHFGVDGELHAEMTETGEGRRRCVSPFRILAAGGRYVLLANEDGTDTVQLYHVPLIDDIRMTEEPRRHVRTIDSLKFGVHPEEHLTSGVTLYAGMPELCTLEIDPETLTAFMLSFGKDIRIESAGEKRIRIEVTAPVSRVKTWALVYGNHAKVTGPASLVREMKEITLATARQYEYT